MAFVEIESWSVERATITGRLADLEMPRWLHNGRDLVLRRSIAVYFSLVVHFGLIWFLAFHLGNEKIGASNMIAEDGPITIVDLAQSQPDAMARKQEKRSEAPTSQLAEFDLTQEASIPAPEWSMTKLRSTATALTIPATDTAGAGRTGAAEGEASYDPYAGAAPMRRGVAAISAKLDIVNLSEAEELGLELDRTQFRTLQNILRKSLCREDCSLFVVVRVSPDGLIKDVTIEGSLKLIERIERLKTGIVGRRLFHAEKMNNEIIVRLSI